MQLVEKKELPKLPLPANISKAPRSTAVTMFRRTFQTLKSLKKGGGKCSGQDRKNQCSDQSYYQQGDMKEVKQLRNVFHIYLIDKT